MPTKQKISKQQQTAKEQAETRKFLTVVAIAAVVLMLLMYFMFAGR